MVGATTVGWATITVEMYKTTQSIQLGVAQLPERLAIPWTKNDGLGQDDHYIEDDC